MNEYEKLIESRTNSRYNGTIWWAEFPGGDIFQGSDGRVVWKRKSALLESLWWFSKGLLQDSGREPTETEIQRVIGAFKVKSNKEK